MLKSQLILYISLNVKALINHCVKKKLEVVFILLKNCNIK